MEDFNEKEVRRCYQFMNHLNESEIRILDPKKKKIPKSIFVHSEDEFVEVCKQYNGKFNLYIGINEREKRGTRKKDVISTKTLVIDIDAKRQNPKQAATEEENKKAEIICNKILEAIKKTNQPLPIKIHSGNGFQLWFAIPEIKIDNNNREEIEEKTQLFQDRIIEIFDEENSIDKIGDLPRIIKIWGTLNIKGDNSKERPFRIAKVIGDWHRIENLELRQQLLKLKKPKYAELEENVDEVDMQHLPPCINHLMKKYENKDGNYWFRIIQFLVSFFMCLGI